jgi:lysozyme family protein
LINNFDFAFNYLMVDEGGYTNDKFDSGGPTNWGITHDDLAKWLERPVTQNDVKNLTKDEAKQIYHSFYWSPLNLDSVKDQRISTAIFDIGVVCWIYEAATMSQRALNAFGAGLQIDGHLGPKSVNALNQVSAPLFIRGLSSLVETHFRAIVAVHPNDAVFLNGWVNRSRRLLTLA